MNGLTTYQDASRRETIKGKKMTKGKKVTKAKTKKRMGKAKAKPVSMPTMPSMAEMMGGK